MDTLIEFCILFILLSLFYFTVTVRWTLTAGTDGGRLRERREREDFTKVLFCVLLTLIYLLSQGELEVCFRAHLWCNIASQLT